MKILANLRILNNFCKKKKKKKILKLEKIIIGQYYIVYARKNYL